jgi:tetratricopeptide (TPR) repeat protein
MKKSFPFVAVVLLFALAVIPAQAADLHERAKNLYDVGDYRAALGLYDRILDAAPNDGLAWDVSAWCLRYLGDRESAEERYKKALTHISGSEAVWPLIGLGEIYIDGRLYKNAIERINEALKIASESDNTEAKLRVERDLGFAKEALSKAAPDEKPQMTDSIARQANNFAETPKPAAKPELQKKTKPAAKAQTGAKSEVNTSSDSKASEKPSETAVRHEVVFGVTLGSQIKDALNVLRQSGCKIAEPFERDGKKYYAVQDLSASFPQSLRDGAEHMYFYVAECDGVVLSLNVEIDYGKNRAFDDLKNTAQRDAALLIGRGEIGVLKTVSNIFSYEINSALTNTYGVWIIVSDKGNQSCRLEIDHIDLYGLSKYWSRN